jgi:hypothetical protein
VGPVEELNELIGNHVLCYALLDAEVIDVDEWIAFLTDAHEDVAVDVFDGIDPSTAAAEHSADLGALLADTPIVSKHEAMIQGTVPSILPSSSTLKRPVDLPVPWEDPEGAYGEIDSCAIDTGKSNRQIRHAQSEGGGGGGAPWLARLGRNGRVATMTLMVRAPAAPSHPPRPQRPAEPCDDMDVGPLGTVVWGGPRGAPPGAMVFSTRRAPQFEVPDHPDWTAWMRSTFSRGAAVSDLAATAAVPISGEAAESSASTVPESPLPPAKRAKSSPAPAISLKLKLGAPAAGAPATPAAADKHGPAADAVRRALHKLVAVDLRLAVAPPVSVRSSLFTGIVPRRRAIGLLHRACALALLEALEEGGGPPLAPEAGLDATESSPPLLLAPSHHRDALVSMLAIEPPRPAAPGVLEHDERGTGPRLHWTAPVAPGTSSCRLLPVALGPGRIVTTTGVVFDTARQCYVVWVETRRDAHAGVGCTSRPGLAPPMRRVLAVLRAEPLVAPRLCPCGASIVLVQESTPTELTVLDVPLSFAILPDSDWVDEGSDLGGLSDQPARKIPGRAAMSAVFFASADAGDEQRSGCQATTLDVRGVVRVFGLHGGGCGPVSSSSSSISSSISSSSSGSSNSSVAGTSLGHSSSSSSSSSGSSILLSSPGRRGLGGHHHQHPAFGGIIGSRQITPTVAPNAAAAAPAMDCVEIAEVRTVTGLGVFETGNQPIAERGGAMIGVYRPVDGCVGVILFIFIYLCVCVCVCCFCVCLLTVTAYVQIQ